MKGTINGKKQHTKAECSHAPGVEQSKKQKKCSSEYVQGSEPSIAKTAGNKKEC